MTLPPLLWAGNAVVGRLIVGSVPPLTLNFLRWALAALLLLPLGWRVLRATGARCWRAGRYLLLLGLLGVGTYNALQYLALVDLHAAQRDADRRRACRSACSRSARCSTANIRRGASSPARAVDRRRAARHRARRPGHAGAGALRARAICTCSRHRRLVVLQLAAGAPAGLDARRRPAPTGHLGRVALLVQTLFGLPSAGRRGGRRVAARRARRSHWNGWVLRRARLTSRSARRSSPTAAGAWAWRAAGRRWPPSSATSRRCSRRCCRPRCSASRRAGYHALAFALIVARHRRLVAAHGLSARRANGAALVVLSSRIRNVKVT